MYEAFIGCAECSYGVMVSTLDFESSDPGSNPGRTSFCTAPAGIIPTSLLLLLCCEAMPRKHCYCDACYYVTIECNVAVSSVLNR